MNEGDRKIARVIVSRKKRRDLNKMVIQDRARHH